jgi:CO/xanthine dehydrogenase FAD-binding subunit
MTTLMTPQTAEDVDAAVAGGAVPVAGGTDLLVAVRAGLEVPVMVDLSTLAAGSPPVARRGDRWRVSAVAPLSIVAARLGDALPGLRSCVAAFASPQIRNRATIGGNLATGSPAGDLQPVIAVADGMVAVRGADGRRNLPVTDFLIGPRRTALRSGEWIEEVEISAPNGVDGFRKVGGRRALVISLVSLAWRWHTAGDGTLRDVRIAVGSAAPTVVRCRRCEEVLAGSVPSVGLLTEAVSALVADLSPIDDLRASAHYRRRAAAGLLAEALGGAVAQDWNAVQQRGIPV